MAEEARGPSETEIALLRSVIEADRRRRAAQFEALPRRPAVHAGQAYPADADEARGFLDRMLAGGPPPASTTPLRRLIAPHIDLRLGAEVYGHAHRRLAAGPRPEVAVVLGVCHAFSEHRFVACRKDFATPLGDLACDTAFLDALEEAYGEPIDLAPWLHLEEHSVEFQALWLAHCWPGNPPRIVPILVGSFEDLVQEGRSPSTEPGIERFIAALRRTIDAEERSVVVIASVDLAHVGPVYDHRAGLDERGEMSLEKADLELLEPVVAGDAEGFFSQLALEQNARQVCGTAPLYVTLRLGEGRGELLSYGQGRIHPESGSVVSFAAVGFLG